MRTFSRVIAPVLATLGALIVVLGYILNGGWPQLSLGLQIWVWQAIGAGVFFVSMLVIVYGSHRRLKSYDKSVEAKTVPADGSSRGDRDTPGAEQLGASTPVERMRPHTEKPVSGGTSNVSPVAHDTSITESRLEDTPLKRTPPPVFHKRQFQTTAGSAEEPDRVFVDVTTEYLRVFYKEHTAVESWKLSEDYVGKWMRVSGLIENVSSLSGSHFIISRDTSNGQVFLYFDNKWLSQVLRLKRGEPIVVVGRIKDMNSNYISLEECEFPDEG